MKTTFPTRIQWLIVKYQRERLIARALIIAAIYITVIISSYRFRHPSMTETELFLNLPHALLWQFDKP